MGEKQIAGGDDKPKDDPRAGGGGEPGKGGGGDPGKGGDGGKGGGPKPGHGPLVDPMPERPKPQQIITGKKKKDDKPRPLFPGKGGPGGERLDG